MELKLLFAQKLKEIRKKQGLTQEQLAELIGREPGFIGSLEIGQKAPSFKTLEKIHQNLNISYYEMFDFEQTHNKNSFITELIRELDGADEKSLKYLVAVNRELIKFLKNK
ncbi:MAG TPA: helix-turn-helix transcriptional regulator [Candidatus Stercorousia faecigallinarum]|nr:helix-turn-helix transcriptional regulator [Candidatus Stercorousia faecigallinarum]